jgi:hypothetical protein
MADNVQAILSSGLWQVFEYDSPESPARVATAVIEILKASGYQIANIEQIETYANGLDERSDFNRAVIHGMFLAIKLIKGEEV